MSEQMIGMIGIGLMGHGIASNLQKNGWEMGFLDHPGNQPIAKLIGNGAQKFATIEELTSASDVIILCVTGSPQVEDVLLGQEGVLSFVRPGTVIIDCSTVVPDSTMKIARRAQAVGARFMDAPMTRTPIEAAQGRLNLIVGGDRDLFDEQLPLLQAFAENIAYAGSVGSGHTMKLLHNFVSLGFSAVLAEAAACANKAGIDPEVLHAVLSAGGGAGVVLDRLAPFILEKDEASFRFSLKNSSKDMDYYTTMSRDLAASNDIASAIAALYRSQVDAGHGSCFVPNLIDLLGTD